MTRNHRVRCWRKYPVSNSRALLDNCSHPCNNERRGPRNQVGEIRHRQGRGPSPSPFWSVTKSGCHDEQRDPFQAVRGREGKFDHCLQFRLSATPSSPCHEKLSREPAQAAWKVPASEVRSSVNAFIETCDASRSLGGLLRAENDLCRLLVHGPSAGVVTPLRG